MCSSAWYTLPAFLVCMLCITLLDENAIPESHKLASNYGSDSKPNYCWKPPVTV